MSSKRILAILDSRELYGKERANILVYNVILSHGAEVYVLYNSHASQQLKNELQSLESAPVLFPRMLEGQFLFLRYLWSYIVSNLKFAQSIVKFKPDYVLFPTEVALSYLLIPLLCFKSKVVFRIGDDPIVLRFSGISSRIYSFFWRKILIRRVDKFVCISDYIKRSLVKSGLEREQKLHVIYNFPPIVNSNNLPSISGPLNYDRIEFGFIGRIVPEKGLLLLVEGFALLKKMGCDFNLLVAGSTTLDVHYSQQVFESISKNKLESNVVFLEEVIDVCAFYSRIDVLCVPSIYPEPSGNVIVEGKWFGRPSIVFDKGGMPELVNHLQDGYICKDITVKELKEALLSYIGEPEIILQHGRAAQESLKHKGITIDDFAAQWHRVFDN